VKTRKTVLTFGAALALCALGLTTRAIAVPLAPGGIVATPGTTAAATPDLAGVVIADTIRPIEILAGNTVIRGWMQDRVVRSNATGTLHFYYRISIGDQSNGAILQVARASFAPAQAITDVDWRIDGLGTKNPRSAKRTADGTWVSFQHPSIYAIMPGEQSRFVFVKTRAKEFKQGVAVLQWQSAFGSGNFTLPAYQPLY
jgi:hypothetical protein